MLCKKVRNNFYGVLEWNSQVALSSFSNVFHVFVMKNLEGNKQDSLPLRPPLDGSDL